MICVIFIVATLVIDIYLATAKYEDLDNLQKSEACTLFAPWNYSSEEIEYLFYNSKIEVISQH